MADKLITHNILSATKTRKVFNALGLFIPMCLTIGIAFVDCSVPYDGVILLTIGVGALLVFDFFFGFFFSLSLI